MARHLQQPEEDHLVKILDDGIYIREANYKTSLDFYQAGDKKIGFVSSFDQHRD